MKSGAPGGARMCKQTHPVDCSPAFSLQAVLYDHILSYYNTLQYLRVKAHHEYLTESKLSCYYFIEGQSTIHASQEEMEDELLLSNPLSTLSMVYKKHLKISTSPVSKIFLKWD